jgi:hypothetical protein
VFFGRILAEEKSTIGELAIIVNLKKLYRKLKIHLFRVALYKAGILFDSVTSQKAKLDYKLAQKFLSKTNNTRLVYRSYTLLALSLKELVI